MAERAPDDLEVADDPQRSRWTAATGGRVVALAAYERAGDLLVFTHTEVDPDLSGRGIASALVRGALDGARARGLRVVPLCPFVAAYVQRHEEYADLVFRSPTRVGADD